MASRDFRYHLLSIGVNRDANGATIRSAERDAFGISWTFAQLGYWRVERNRCLTGTQATPSAIEAHLAYCAQLNDLDLLLVYWSGHVFSVDPLLAVLSQQAGVRRRDAGDRRLDRLAQYSSWRLSQSCQSGPSSRPFGA